MRCGPGATAWPRRPNCGPSSAWLIWALPIVCALLSVAWWERPWLAALLGCYAVALGVLAAIDLDTRRLPDAITWPLAGATLLSRSWPSRWPGTARPATWSGR